MYWYLKAFKQYITFQGRAQRKEYWMFTLMYLILSFVATFFDILLGLYDPISGLGVLTAIFIILHILPSIAVMVRRLHDINKSGWWLWIGLIPVLGWIVLLIFMITDSKENNQYGINPKSSSESEETSNNFSNSMPSQTQQMNHSTISQIEDLSRLLEKGILTEEEFNTKKEALLARI